MRRLWWLIRPYWTGPERWVALRLLAVVVGLNLGEVYISVLLNKWNNDFYNALQTLDKPAFLAALGRFSWLAFLFIVVAVYKIYLNQLLRLKWRRGMTDRLLGDWLANKRYYRLQWNRDTADNPDQRIAEDIEQFIGLTLGLSLGLLSAVVTLFSFLHILWGLSGPLDMTIAGQPLHLPGYMVWVALLYALAGTWITVRLGRPLVGLNFEQQRREADFRFSLVRLRENSESIAFYQGEEWERAHLARRFGLIYQNFLALMRQQKKLTWFTAGYSQIAIIFPILVASPRFFAQKIQLGGLMQTASAFGQVQGSLSYIVDSYTSIATWKAVTQRLLGFQQALEEPKSDSPALPDPTCHRQLTTRNLRLFRPDGRLLLESINLDLGTGDSLLITGPSGAGKSTLLRALAGLWPFMEGEIQLPAPERCLFLPQRLYLPLGTLREALSYPSHDPLSPEMMATALHHCGLKAFMPHLDETTAWTARLSPGEQQRLGFARILLRRPDFVFLDEATSALDEPAEAALYRLLQQHCPQTVIVSVGHRSTLREWHQRHLSLS